MKSPLVSVIVPTYNRAYCIEATIDSALGQTHRELEILVVDDGSTDGTRDVIERRYGREARVRYVYQANGGVSSARNHGQRLARGEYVAYLDSDDRWVPWKVTLQLACFSHLPDVGMVFTDIDMTDAQGRIVRRAAARSMYDSFGRLDAGRPFTSTIPLAEVAPELCDVVGGAALRWGDAFSQMIVGNLVQTSTTMIRRAVAERAGWFDESMSQNEDYDYFLRVSREAPVGFADLTTVTYQMGKPDQLTSPRFKLRLATNYLTTIEPALSHDRARIHLSDEVVQELLARTHVWIAQECATAGQGRDALRHLAQSLEHRAVGWQDARILALALLPASIGETLRQVKRTVCPPA